MRVSAQEFRDHVAGKKPNKYGAQQIVVDGVLFHSKGEARYWEVLRLREKAGEIYGLERQKRYDIDVNGQRIGFYKCDFAFYDNIEKRYRVLDFKGVLTKEFRRTKKLIKAIHNVEIEVVR